MERSGEQPARREVKVYEMFLVGQVLSQRVERVLDILAGLTASQPQRRIEQHVIYRPDRPPPEREVAKGGSQTIAQHKMQTAAAASKELSMVRLVRDLLEENFASSKKVNDHWRQVHWELPTASQKEAILRGVMESSVSTEQPEQYMELLKYQPITQLLFDGYQFVQGNIVLFLHKVRRFPDAEHIKPNAPLPPMDSFTSVDPADTALLQATIELYDATSTELINLALSELKAMQEQLKGVVELVVPERLSFDTRVK